MLSKALPCHHLIKNALSIDSGRKKQANCRSSLILTLQSVSELHRFNAEALADSTAGREFHPALKIYVVLFDNDNIT